MQVVSIPQFENFTLNQNYTATPKFDGKLGGVFAIAVNNICDLSEGKINVEGKGGALPYGLDYIGNAQNSLKLPLGENDGSVFILAKTLKLNANSRIGVTAVKNLEGYANYHAANPGANLMLIADNVENFKQDCFSTNGGFCFIYCD